MNIKLDDALASLKDRTKEKLTPAPKVLVKDGSFDVDKLPIGAEWHRLTDVVAVVFDLKSSTNLEKGRKPASVASIYDAGVGGVVRVFNTHGADFVDIQGDGGFGLFWGDRRYERAVTAGITIRTFSIDFEAQLKAKWPDAPTTGFKVGIASGPVLAKKVGLERHLNLQEPVWAGHPVNYAAKLAQQTEPELLAITASVWDAIENNDYLTFSCTCNGGPKLLWESATFDKIPDEERYGQTIENHWCKVHGEEYCNAILDGETKRSVVEAQRHARTLLGYGSPQLITLRKSRDQLRASLAEERRSANAEALVARLLRS